MRNNRCKNCDAEIQIAIFKGGDWCSDDCRKALVTNYDSAMDELLDEMNPKNVPVIKVRKLLGLSND